MGKTKRVLALLLTMALVIQGINLGTLTVKAGNPYRQSLTLTRFEGSGSQTGLGIDNVILVAAGSLATTAGNSTAGAFEAGVTADSMPNGSNLGSTRIGFMEFALPQDIDVAGINTATLTIHVQSANGNISSGWTKAALFETSNPQSWTAGDGNVEAKGGNYNSNATIWSKEQISKTNVGAKTFDVTNVVKNAINEGSSNIVLRLQTVKSGYYVYDTSSDTPPALIIDSAPATTATVNFIDADTEDILETETIDSLSAGDSYSYEMPLFLEKEDTFYVYDSENENNAASIELLSADPEENVITLYYKAPTIQGIAEEIEIVTRVGIAPVLPEAVPMILVGAADPVDFSVTWDNIDPDQYSAEGTFTVYGTLDDGDTRVSATVNVVDKEELLMAYYSFDEDTYADSTKKHDDAIKENTVNTVAGLSGNAMQLPGGNYGTGGSLKLPDDLLQIDGVTQDDFTVSMFVKRASQGNSFAMALHSTGMGVEWPGPTGYIGFINKDSQFAVEYKKDGQTQTLERDKYSTAIEKWIHVAIVTSGSTGESWLYENGEQIAYLDGIDTKASDLTAQNNYLGRAPWPDTDYNAAYDEFKVYNAVLTPEEIKDLGSVYEISLNETKEKLEIITDDPDAVTEDLILPATVSADNGLTANVSWTSSNQKIITNSGAVIRPVGNDAEVTLTATISYGGHSVTKEFTLTVKAVTVVEQAEPASVRTLVGMAPRLPEMIKGETNDGGASNIAVIWDPVSPSQYAAPGTFVVNGVFDSSDVPVTVEVTVIDAVADYSFDDEIFTDSTGNHDPAQKVDHVEIVEGLSGKGFKLNGGDQGSGAVQLPDDLLQVDEETQDDFTISMFVKREEQGEDNGPFAMTLHAIDIGIEWPGPEQYMGVLNGDEYFSSEYRNGPEYNDTQKVERAGYTTTVGEWAHIVMVTSGSTGESWLYEDGKEIAYSNTITVKASDLPAQNNYLGRAAWPDPDYAGSFDEFKVYNTALDEHEVAYLGDSVYKEAMANAKEALVLDVADDTLITENITLPVTLTLDNGVVAEVIWETNNSSVIGTDGTVTRPFGHDADVMLTATLTYKGYTETKEFPLTVKKELSQRDTYDLTLERFEGSGTQNSESGKRIIIGTRTGSGTNGTNTSAAFREGVTANDMQGNLGSDRAAAIQFALPEDIQERQDEITDAVLTFKVAGVNNMDASNGRWTKAAVFETANPENWAIDNSDNNAGTSFPALNNDYSYDATMWSNEQISAAWVDNNVTIDVTKAVKNAVANGKDSIVLRIQTVRSGYSIYGVTNPQGNTGNCNKVDDTLNTEDYPTLVVNTGDKTTATINIMNSDSDEPLSTTTVEDLYVGEDYSQETEEIITVGGETYFYDSDNTKNVTSITLSEDPESNQLYFYYYPEADKTELIAAIAGIDDLTESLYTPASWAALQTTLDAAKIILNKQDATQAEISTATTNLNNAVASLVKKTYTITFDPDNGSAIFTSTVTVGEKVAEPEAPSKDGYSFIGWYTTGSTSAFNFNTAITADLTLTAKWSEDEVFYTVTFDPANGSNSSSIQVAAGEKATAPTNPSYPGCNFLGWYAEGADVVFDFNTSITANLTLTAKWSAHEVFYTVTFDPANGSDSSSVQVAAGEKAGEPTTPLYTGYKFLGWYATGATSAFDFATLIQSNLTLTAKWQAVVAPGINIQNASVKVAKTVYNGKTQKPKTTVTLNGKTLMLGTDYTAAYKNSKKPGKATVTITGIGNYTGSKSVNFNILPKANKIKKLTNKKGLKATVKFSKSTGASGYEVYYSTKKNFKSSKKIVTKKTTGTIKKLKLKKTYYVRTRAFVKVDGKKVYSAYSPRKKVTIKK